MAQTDIPDFLLCPLPAGNETEWLLVDSGAGLHACPKSFGNYAPLEQTAKEIARTATGEPVDHYGVRHFAFQFPDGRKGVVRMNVMGVGRPARIRGD